jgi:hypothetical protein
VPDLPRSLTAFATPANRRCAQALSITKPALPHPTNIDAHLSLRLLVVEGTVSVYFLSSRFSILFSLSYTTAGSVYCSYPFFLIFDNGQVNQEPLGAPSHPHGCCV